jgi:hypothetical protein
VNQLRSNGFTVLLFPYESIVAAFAVGGIDADYGEGTSDAAMLRKVRQCEKLAMVKMEAIVESLLARGEAGLKDFMCALRKVLARRIVTLHPSATNCTGSGGRWPVAV